MIAGSAMELTAPSPPQPDFDQYYFTANQMPVHTEYFYDEERGLLHINDPVWGCETIGEWEGDQLLVELFNHPVFRRLSGVEQLTLPKQYATVPNTTGFTRWEHAWGSIVFVRKMIREAEERGQTFTPREKLLKQVQTGTSDAGHRKFSHLFDWELQGYGGPEDQHDIDLMGYLELGGVNDIFRRRSIDPSEVIFPNKKDWIECPSPDLCVDRVDYIARETIRWLDPWSVERWRNAFMIDDQDRLIMKNQADAKYFGVCAGLLSSEHHNQPVHRLQLQLFGELVKGMVVADPLIWRERNLHILDSLYSTDRAALENVRSVGPLNNDLDMLLLDIARRQRQIFAMGREAEIRGFLEQVRAEPGLGLRPSFPHPMRPESYRTEYTGLTPLNVEIRHNSRYGKTARITPRKATLDVSLPALKARSIDPLYLDGNGETQRLSATDPHYAAMINDCRAYQRQAYMAKMHLAPHAIERLTRDIGEVNQLWEQELARPRHPASAELLREELHYIGILAVVHSPNAIVAADRTEWEGW